MIEKLLIQDLIGALAEAKPCVDSKKAVEARSSPEVGLNSENMMDVTTLGYFQCAQAQLEAATGDLRSAKAHVADAEATAVKWTTFYQSQITVLGWNGRLNVTKGFLSEKSGNLTEANRLYATDAYYGTIRSAEVALIESRYDDAAVIGKKMIESNSESPHGMIVLGGASGKARR